jgi:hypothetical protein
MLNVIYAECHYAECCYAECHFADCRYADCHYAKCRNATNKATSKHFQHYLLFDSKCLESLKPKSLWIGSGIYLEILD